jgi:phosphoglycolate phosphatase-like HAD superfamily hydrolase
VHSGEPGPAGTATSPGAPGQPARAAPAATPPNWRWRTVALSGQAVVFDLDGVLSDAASRQHFLEWGRRDWDAFFDACGDDPLVDEVARLLELLDASLRIVLLTGRPLRVQPQTLSWLAHHRLRWDLLVMRNRGDHAQVARFKQGAVRELRAHGLEPRLAFEDDPRNRDMFHAEGVPCIYIHSGYYE